jgi:hypothetical protein
MEPDPSRRNSASWSAKDYVGKSYLYTPEKMLVKSIEEDSDSTRPSTKSSGKGGAPNTEEHETVKTSSSKKSQRTPLPNSPIRKSHSEAKPKGHRDNKAKSTQTRPPASNSMKTFEGSKQLSLRAKEAEEQMEEGNHVAYLKTLLDNPRGKAREEPWEEKGGGT